MTLHPSCHCFQHGYQALMPSLTCRAEVVGNVRRKAYSMQDAMVESARLISSRHTHLPGDSATLVVVPFCVAEQRQRWQLRRVPRLRRSLA